MKKVHQLLIALQVVALSCVLTACDDDGDELIGKWSGNDGGYYVTWEFLPDGQFIYTEVDRYETYRQTNNTYVVDGSTLRIDWNIENGVTDDYSIGKYRVSGDTFTYTYTWHDGSGKWDDDEEYTITLTKQ